MKKTLLTIAALALVATHAYAQGHITFSTGTANLIKFSTDGTTATAFPGAGIPTFGTASVGLFAAPNGTALNLVNGLPDFSSWTALLVVLPVGQTVLGDGTAFDSDLLMPFGTAGQNLEFEVVAWTGTDTTWNLAATHRATDLLGFSGDTFNSTPEGALGWSQPTTTGVPIPAALLTGTGGYNGIVVRSNTVAAPEPSSYVLGGTAAGILMLSRFLKNRRAKSAMR